jgi:predicted MFS family arabinose efflux permease
MHGIATAELAEIGARSEKQPVPWRRLFALPQLWLITIAYFCYAWGSWFYFGWFTTWLVRGAGFSVREMGVVASFPFVMGLLGNLIGGVVSERLVERHGRRIAYRLVTSICLAGTACLLAAMSVAADKTHVVVFASLGLGVMDLMLPSAWAMCMSLGGDFGGTATGVMNTAGNLGGWVGAIVFGYVVTATGSYNVPLRLIAAMVLVSAMLFARVDCTRGLQAKTSH